MMLVSVSRGSDISLTNPIHCNKNVVNINILKINKNGSCVTKMYNPHREGSRISHSSMCITWFSGSTRSMSRGWGKQRARGGSWGTVASSHHLWSPPLTVAASWPLRALAFLIRKMDQQIRRLSNFDISSFVSFEDGDTVMKKSRATGHKCQSWKGPSGLFLKH